MPARVNGPTGSGGKIYCRFAAAMQEEVSQN